MSPPGSAHPAFSFGGLSVIGGAVGYYKKGSKASLGAGLVCGSLLIGSGLLISTSKEYEGHGLATATSGIMTAGMAQRYMKTGKMMPAGIVAGLAAASMAFHAKKTLEWRP